jgi:methionyl-tRNA formyltransferase
MSEKCDADSVVIFFGTPQFSVPTLEALAHQKGVRVGAVITQPDRASGRGGQIQPSPIKKKALELGIPVFQPTSLRKEFSALKGELEKIGPFDVGVVIAFGQILPKEVLDFPRHGCVNIHASLLPRWRGAAPIHRAIEAGDPSTGVCLMKMDVGLDTGPVYSSVTIPILPTDTTLTLHDRLSHDGAALLAKDLTTIVAGHHTAISQPSEGVTYANKITTSECKIDWDRSAEEIARAIRAFSPHPGSFTELQSKRLKILKARSAVSNSTASPGTVITSTADQLTVQCGSGTSLLIEEVQLEGKKKMSVGDFLRGIAVPPGTRLVS